MYAQDVNPWASWCLVTMLDLPTVDELGAAADRLYDRVADQLRDAYGTRMSDGTRAEEATTLRVATGSCPHCDEHWRLFPAALVSLATQRVDCGGKSGFVPSSAGHLNEATVAKASRCSECRCRGRSEGSVHDRQTVHLPWLRVRGQAERTCWRARILLASCPGGSGVRRDGLREIGPPTKGELAKAVTCHWSPKRRLPAIDDGVEKWWLAGARHAVVARPLPEPPTSGDREAVASRS